MKFKLTPIYICYNLILASATAGLIAKLDKSVSVHYFTQLQVPLALHWSRMSTCFGCDAKHWFYLYLEDHLIKKQKRDRRGSGKKDQYLSGEYKRPRECSSSDGEAHKLILKTRQNFYPGKKIECPKSNQ